MSLIYEIDRNKNELHVIAEGTIRLSDIQVHLQQEREDLVLPWKELIDGRSAALDLSAGEVRWVVQWLRDLSRSGRLGPTAVVVSNDVSYGIMRMLQVLVEDVCPIYPFRDLAEAERWLQAQARAPGLGNS